MSIDSAADFDGMTRAGRVVAEALNAMVQATQVGMTTPAGECPRLRSVSERCAHGCLAAHHEHTMIITNNEPIIVTRL